MVWIAVLFFISTPLCLRAEGEFFQVNFATTEDCQNEMTNDISVQVLGDYCLAISLLQNDAFLRLENYDSVMNQIDITVGDDCEPTMTTVYVSCVDISLSSESCIPCGGGFVHIQQISTSLPTNDPTEDPTEDPTNEPTNEPTDEPTDEPTEVPYPDNVIFDTEGTLLNIKAGITIINAGSPESGILIDPEDVQVFKPNVNPISIFELARKQEQLETSLNSLTDQVRNLGSLLSDLTSRVDDIDGTVTDHTTLIDEASDLHDALDEVVANLTKKVQTMGDHISELDDQQQTNLENIDDLQTNLGDLTRDFGIYKTDTNDRLASLSSSVDGLGTEVDEIDDEVTVLAQAYDDIKDCGDTGQVHTSDGCIDILAHCQSLPSPFQGGTASHAGFALVGMKSTFTCYTGYYRVGPAEATCQDNGQWTTVPECKKCMENCADCSDGSTCNQCESGTHYYRGKCSTPWYSCKQAVTRNIIPSSSGMYKVAVRNDGNRLVDALCTFADGRIYTNIECTALNKASSCKETYAITHSDTCKDYGYNITPYRSKNHFIALTNKWGKSGAWFSHAGSVYKTSNGGSYTGYAMKYGSVPHWRVFDGGPWWLRDSSYSEPNGDYSANCWLSQYQWEPNDVRFNDGNCNYATSKYICIDSEY